MKELLEYIIKGIVNNPDAVEVTERESVDFPGLIILSIKVDSEDTGIVIGKRGRTINAIRDIISISAIRNQKRVKVLLEEDENKRNPKSSDDHKPEPGNELTEESTDELLSDEV